MPGASQKFISDEVLQRTRDYIDAKSTIQMIPNMNNPSMWDMSFSNLVRIPIGLTDFRMIELNPGKELRANL
jgi:hypothetical protein